MSRHARRLRPLLLVLAAALVAPGGIAAQPPSPDPTDPPPARPGRPVRAAAHTTPRAAIVVYRPGVGVARRAAVRAAAGVEQVRMLRGVDAELVRPRGRSLDAALLALRGRPDVQLAVPDQRRSLSVDPSGEAGWPEQWGHHNTGQPTGFDEINGRPDVDVDGLEALAITPGSSSVVVAVIDDGVDFSHPDLQGHAWVNARENGMDANGKDKRTNSLDDDGNGFVDDTYGWDFCNGDRTVHDRNEDGHGTGVAGAIAASLDGQGTVGIAPSTKIMALKFLADPEDDPYGECGWDSQAIEAIAYAKKQGVRIINASWGSPDPSPALGAAIEASGALFVTAAGNEAWNIDRNPVYPAAFTAPNILTVAAVNSRGGVSPFSNYGSVSVDLAAPGEQILVPCPADASNPDPGWCWMDGTSFASPYAAGTAALIAAVRPELLASPTALRSRLITSGVPLTSLAGKTASGKLLNARRALDFVVPTLSAVRRIQPIEGSTLGSTWTQARISWPTMRDDVAAGSYRLQQRRDGGTWETVTNATTAANRNVNVALSGTYEYRVTPRDAAGNLGSPGEVLAVRPVRHEESSGSLAWSGTWRAASVTGASGGGTRYTTGWGAGVTLEFSGRAASVVAPLGPAGSSVKVYVDGTYVKTVSLYSRTAAARRTIFATSWTSPGDHTVRLVNAPVSGRYRAEIDAFVVLR